MMKVLANFSEEVKLPSCFVASLIRSCCFALENGQTDEDQDR